MEGVLIRKFKISDTLAIQQLINKILNEYGFSSNPNSPIDEDLTRIQEVYGNNFWVAIDNNQIVGTVAFHEVSQTIAKLKRMFVKKDYRGKHIGLALLEKAVEEIKKQGYQEIILNTSPRMKRAHAFYERFGFEKVGEDKDRFHYRLLLNQ